MLRTLPGRTARLRDAVKGIGAMYDTAEHSKYRKIVFCPNRRRAADKSSVLVSQGWDTTVTAVRAVVGSRNGKWFAVLQ
jgi:hypothetical protein